MLPLLHLRICLKLLTVVLLKAFTRAQLEDENRKPVRHTASALVGLYLLICFLRRHMHCRVLVMLAKLTVWVVERAVEGQDRSSCSFSELKKRNGKSIDRKSSYLLHISWKKFFSAGISYQFSERWNKFQSSHDNWKHRKVFEKLPHASQKRSRSGVLCNVSGNVWKPGGSVT